MNKNVLDMFWETVETIKSECSFSHPLRSFSHPLNSLSHPLRSLSHPLRSFSHPLNSPFNPRRGIEKQRVLQELINQYIK